MAKRAPPPAPEAETAPCPYLVSLDAFQRISNATSDSDNNDKAPLSTVARVQLLQEALGVQHADANPRTAAWVEFCFGVLSFARDEPARFESDEKVLTVLTIANSIFQFATIKGATAEGDALLSTLSLPSVQSCYDKFRERVREVSCPLPPPPAPPTASSEDDSHTTSDPVLPSSPSLQLPPLAQLSTAEVASFVAFMSTTFFRHLRAYQSLFTRTRVSVTREVDVHVETPFPPQLLAAATLLPDS